MFRRCLMPLATTVAVLALSAGSAAAATLTVNTTQDEANPHDGMCSLREAIQAVDSPGTANGDCAPAAFGANTIVLRAGRYSLQFPQSELQIAPTVTTLMIAGATESGTIIDASGLANRVFDIPAGPQVTIQNLTITGGRAPNGAAGTSGGNGLNGGQGGDGANGGAILNAGSLSLLNVSIVNSAAGNGGAGGNAAVFGGTGGGDGGPGGAGGSGGAIYNTGTLSLTGVTVAGNLAGDGGAGGSGENGGSGSGGSGGGGGSAGSGGGLLNAGGTVTIVASTLRGDASGSGGSGGNGGAVPSGLHAGGVGGNGGAAGDGGAVLTHNGSLSLTNSTFASNTTGVGGAGGNGGAGGSTGPNGGDGSTGGDGGALEATGTATVTFLQMTIAGNTVGAGGAGGTGGTGATNGTPGATGNSGSTGGVILTGHATASFQNSILAVNASANCGPGTVTDSGHNLSFGAPGCPASFLSADPKLGALQYNGGPTQTIGLDAGSAAIDQVPATGGGCPATDQRGLKRPSGKACDIGAYEVTAPTILAGKVRATGPHSVAIQATVTANSADASVTIPGLKSSVVHVSGLTPTAVTLNVRGLNLSRSYNYNIVAISSDGSVASLGRGFRVPIVSALKLTRTFITYVDDTAATSTFQLLRHGRGVLRGGVCVAQGRGKRGKPCQWILVARLRHHDRRGRNRVRRTVAPGRYRLQATPDNGSATGLTVTGTFTIR